jgi:hypothetical protein
MAGPYLTNPLEQINQAWQTGRNMAFNEAAGQALTSSGQAQQDALTKATQINPSGALDLQKQTQQVQGQKLVSMAKFLLNAPEGQRDAVYQSMKPTLAQVGIDPSTLPATYDDTVAQTAQSLAQAYTPYSAMPAAVRTAQYFQQGLSPEDREKAMRIKVGLDPRASNPNYSQIEIPDGQGGKVLAFYNKKTGKPELPDYTDILGPGAMPSGGATSAVAPASGAVVPPTTPGTTLPNVNDGFLPFIQKANERIANGEDPAKVQADLLAQKQTYDAQQGALSGGGGAAPADASGVPTDSTVSPDGSTVTVRPQDGAAEAPAPAAVPPPSAGRIGFTPPKQSSLQEKIAVAKSLGATNDDVKQMVLGRGASPDPQDTGLSDDALKNLAWDYALNGKLPPVGRGGSGQAQRTAVINATADLAKEYGVSPQELATTAGRNKAFQASLSNTQKQTDTVDRASETFHRNADLMQSLADQVNAQGPQAWNQFVIGVKNKVTTDPTVAAYLAAQQTASQEYAKVASGATGAAGSTDSAREHANAVINAFQTPDQLRGVLSTLRMDTENQRQVAHEKLQEIRHSMQVFGTSGDTGSQAQAQPAAPAASAGTPAKVTSQAEFDALPSGALFVNPKDGKIMRKH